MPNQRHPDKKGGCYYEWEANIELLRYVALKEGKTLTSLIQGLTRHHLMKHNIKPKTDD